MWLDDVGSIPTEAHHFNQAIELATWQRIKQYDNSVAGAYKIVDANGNNILWFFAWLIQF